MNSKVMHFWSKIFEVNLKIEHLLNWAPRFNI